MGFAYLAKLESLECIQKKTGAAARMAGVSGGAVAGDERDGDLKGFTSIQPRHKHLYPAAQPYLHPDGFRRQPGILYFELVQ